MLGDITLSQLATFLTLVVGFITSATFIVSKVKEIMGKALEPTNAKIDKVEEELSNRIDKVNLEQTKNFIVRCLTDTIELDPVTKQRFFEQYEHYIELGGNSYIKHEVERLQKEGKL